MAFARRIRPAPVLCQLYGCLNRAITVCSICKHPVCANCEGAHDRTHARQRAGAT